MKKKILFPTDFSEASQNAFHYCLRLAAQTDCAVDVLHVVAPVVAPGDVPVVSGEDTVVKKVLGEEAMEAFCDNGMQNTPWLTTEKQPEVTRKVIVGGVKDSIAKEAKEREYAFLVMSLKEHHNLGEWILGPVSTSMMDKISTPILYVPEKYQFESITSIGYATDFDHSDPMQIFQLYEIFEPSNPMLYCVHFSKEVAGDLEENQMRLVERFFSNHPPALQIKYEILEGQNLEQSLDEFSKLHGLNLLVFNHEERSFLDRLFHRSQSKSMALRSNIPVFVFSN
ncbi:MAG: universal stress protein [Saprospiraceae bacterium]|nr:universal stress protein [Saprospiraceae bacterium]